VLKPPTKHVKGKVDPIPPLYVETKPEWTILIDATTDELWIDMVVAATQLKVSMATSADQLKEMFQVNKALYGKLKELNPAVYADVMDTFANAKRSFF
jgi:hypothetical protein